MKEVNGKKRIKGTVVCGIIQFIYFTFTKRKRNWETDSKCWIEVKTGGLIARKHSKKKNGKERREKINPSNLVPSPPK